MARIAGTGIKEASEKSKKVAQVYYGGPEAENRRRVQSFLKEFGEKSPLSGGSGGTITVPATVPVKQVSAEGDETFERSDFFSMTTDPRNKIKTASADLGSLDVGDSFTKQADKNIASASGDFSNTFNESDYQGYTKALGIKNYRGLPPTMQRMLRENYRDDVRDGRYKEGQLINQAPVKEKPSFIDQTKNLAGSVFNAITGTQPAAASQVPGGVTSQTQFTSSNLDAAKASTGDTSFASYRMAGQTPTTTTPQTLSSKQESKTYEQNRLKTGEKFADRGQREAVNASGFQQANVRGSALNTGKDESKRPKTVTVDGQTVAARQTVASLPSNYKQTEAESFRKAAAFKEAQKIAKRNPNVSVGVDSKGQPKATATNNTGRARAQAAAVNRKLSGKSISQVKAANRQAMRAAAAERQATFKKTGKSTVGARRAAAKASMRAKAKARHASFKKKRAAKAAAKAAARRAKARNKARQRQRRGGRGRRGRRGRRCDIFLKYNISPLMNMNLIRDDLAEVAYFVKEIQE